MPRRFLKAEPLAVSFGGHGEAKLNRCGCVDCSELLMLLLLTFCFILDAKGRRRVCRLGNDLYEKMFPFLTISSKT